MIVTEVQKYLNGIQASCAGMQVAASIVSFELACMIVRSPKVMLRDRKTAPQDVFRYPNSLSTKQGRSCRVPRHGASFHPGLGA
jgi:hypothetical protein